MNTNYDEKTDYKQTMGCLFTMIAVMLVYLLVAVIFPFMIDWIQDLLFIFSRRS